MKKRIALILMVLALLITSVACGGDPKPKPTPTDPKGSEEAPKTDVTDPPAPHSEEKAEIYVLIKNRGDLSFWDSIASGGDRAAVDFADKANVYVIETTADVMANLDAMYEAVDKGANLIITAGDYKDNVAQLAVEHPEVGFVMISEDMTKDSDNNIYCIDFRVSEAAFLGGVVAADIASSDKDNVAATKTVGLSAAWMKSPSFRSSSWATSRVPNSMTLRPRSSPTMLAAGTTRIQQKHRPSPSTKMPA